MSDGPSYISAVEVAAIANRRALGAEAALDRVRNALAMLDGHTCHEGHTDADHLRLYRSVVNEVERTVRQSAVRALQDGSA